MSYLINLMGKRFGKWTVLQRGKNEKQGQATWVCRCDCGTVKEVAGYRLRGGGSTRCRDCAPEVFRTHGLSKHRIHKIWRCMKARCEHKADTAFPSYGGRGISVCKEWHESKNFFEWAFSHGYRDNLTIDRIDNDGDYCPENCRWATLKEQSRNKRVTLRLNFRGVVKTLKEWAETYGINYYTIRCRARKDWTPEQVLGFEKRGRTYGIHLRGTLNRVAQ